MAASVTDEESTEEVIENLERFGEETARQQLQVATKKAITSLEAVGIAAVRKGTELEDAVKKTAESIETVGRTAVKNDLGDVIMKSTESLDAVGVAAAEKKLKGATEQVAKSLGAIGTEATQRGINLEKALKEIEQNPEPIRTINEEPCGKPQGINSHITNTTAVTLWQATGNPQVEKNENEREVAIKQAVESLRAEEAVKQVVKSLEDVGVAAAKNKLDKGTEQAAKSIRDVGVAAAGNEKEWEDVVKQVIKESLKEVGTTSVEYKLRNAAEQAVKFLKELGTTSVEHELGEVARLAVVSIEEVGKTAVKKELGEVALRAARYLKSIVEDITNIIKKASAKEKLGEVAWQVVSSLEALGKTSVEYERRNEAKQVVLLLKAVKEIVAKYGELDGKAELVDQALNDLWKQAKEKGLDDVAGLSTSTFEQKRIEN